VTGVPSSFAVGSIRPALGEQRGAELVEHRVEGRQRARDGVDQSISGDHGGLRPAGGGPER
jgi:hypothetical protein